MMLSMKLSSELGAMSVLSILFLVLSQQYYNRYIQNLKEDWKKTQTIKHDEAERVSKRRFIFIVYIPILHLSQ